MGSLVLVAGKVSRIIGIVPGVPKGVRGSTKGVHEPRGATWAVGVCALAYMGQGHQPQEAHAPRVQGREESQRGKAQGGSTSPLGAGSPPTSAHGDHSGTPRDVRDLIRDSEQLSGYCILYLYNPSITEP